MAVAFAIKAREVKRRKAVEKAGEARLEQLGLILLIQLTVAVIALLPRLIVRPKRRTRRSVESAMPSDLSGEAQPHASTRVVLEEVG